MSVEPMLDRLNAGNDDEMNVAQMAELVAQSHQGIELISRSANGTITVQYFDDNGAGNDIVDPQTGNSVKPQQRSVIFSFFKQLHRTLYIGTTGRVIAGIIAGIMFLACFSGMFMLAKRLGGWRQLFTSSKGKKIPRLHVDVSRWVIIGLFITSLTGTYMSLVKFGFIDDGKGSFLAFPEEVLGDEPSPIAELSALINTPLSNLRELRFPFTDDPFDVFTLTTSDGQGYIDQATGEMLVYEANGLSRTIFEFFYMIHTGQGLWWLGALLGLSAIGLPILAITGTIIWWRRRPKRGAKTQNANADQAEAIILVGSEGNVTQGFAQHLQQQLTALGAKIHLAEMNKFNPQKYTNAKRIFFITATYGDGDAPETAKKFMQKLAVYDQIPEFEYAVLGFGDKQFSQFSKFAFDVEAALQAKGWQSFLPIETIDRQSSQAFEAWGVKLGAALNMELTLNHVVAKPKTHHLVVKHIEDHIYADEFSTRILQFSLPESMAGFDAGDLVGILPPDSEIARYYSLATSKSNGQLGICVAKKHGGLCSVFLHGLKIGDPIEAYIQPNEHFRPANNQAPFIMVGAGTGIAPFIGFIANNQASREAHLYWGGRHPEADCLYQDNLAQALKNGQLTKLNTAFSRIESGQYVQDKLAQDAKNIHNLMAQNGQIIVCGGRDMAMAVKLCLADMGLDITALAQQNRYIEDVY